MREEVARYIVHFEDASKDDHPRLGGKCAGLATLIAAGAAVPTGFAVTAQAYADMLATHGLHNEIAKRTDQISPDDVAGQAAVAEEIRDLITARPMPTDVSAAIRAGYQDLGARAGRDVPVAVRSSGTAEDLPEASFAGQGDTYLWTVRRHQPGQGFLGEPVQRPRDRLSRQAGSWPARSPHGSRRSANGRRLRGWRGDESRSQQRRPLEDRHRIDLGLGRTAGVGPDHAGLFHDR